MKKVKSFVRNFSRKGLKKFFETPFIFLARAGLVSYMVILSRYLIAAQASRKHIFYDLFHQIHFIYQMRGFEKQKTETKRKTKNKHTLVRKETTNKRRRKQKWRKNIEPENERSNERKQKIKEELNKNLNIKERKKKRSM